MADETTTPWIKASKSSSGGQCAQLRRHGNRIEVRDSKDPDGPVLSFTRGEIEALLDGSEKGEFRTLLEGL